MVLGNIIYCIFRYFVYKTVTFFGCPFQNNSTISKITTQKLHSLPDYAPLLLCHNTRRFTWHKFGLFPFRSPLLGKSLRFLFLALLRCFSSGRSLLYPMNSDKDILGLPRWVSPFGNLRIKAWLTAPRSLWQPSASFIASWYQGIHLYALFN